MFKKTNVEENKCQIKSNIINQINTLKGFKFTKKINQNRLVHSEVNFPISRYVQFLIQ